MFYNIQVEFRKAQNEFFEGFKMWNKEFLCD